MGLDMYLQGNEFVTSFGDTKRETRGAYEVESYNLNIGYWRKYAPLHCYITNTYTPGVDDCQPITLTAEDLRDIADAIRAGKLTDDDDSHGFFFGTPEMWAEDRKNAENDAKVFDGAADWLESSPDDLWRSVTYTASWQCVSNKKKVQNHGDRQNVR